MSLLKLSSHTHTGDNNTQLLEDLVWSLRSWPLDLVQWRTTNSHRLDIKFNPEQDRYGDIKWLKLSLPYPIKSYHIMRNE